MHAREIPATFSLVRTERGDAYLLVRSPEGPFAVPLSSGLGWALMPAFLGADLRAAALEDDEDDEE